jgi:hypothetical protein
MAATATILDAQSGIKGKATVRYFGDDGPLAAGDTVGITADAIVHLHTVPAGGQTLYQALLGLAEDINIHANGDGAAVSKNQELDCCLHIQGALGANIVVATPVYVVA